MEEFNDENFQLLLELKDKISDRVEKERVKNKVIAGEFLK